MGGTLNSHFPTTTRNLSQIHSLKNLASMSTTNKNVIMMESASTFVTSTNKKYYIPTFSKLQLAKRQNYEKIMKRKAAS